MLRHWMAEHKKLMICQHNSFNMSLAPDRGPPLLKLTYAGMMLQATNISTVVAELFTTQIVCQICQPHSLCLLSSLAQLICQMPRQMGEMDAPAQAEALHHAMKWV